MCLLKADQASQMEPGLVRQHLHPQGQQAVRDVPSGSSSLHLIPLLCLPQFCLCLWVHVLAGMPIILPVYSCFFPRLCGKMGGEKKRSANSRHYYHVAFTVPHCTFIYFLLWWQMLASSQCGNTVVKMVFTSFACGPCEPMTMMRAVGRNWTRAAFSQWRTLTLPKGNEQPLDRNGIVRSIFLCSVVVADQMHVVVAQTQGIEHFRYFLL